MCLKEELRMPEYRRDLKMKCNSEELRMQEYRRDLKMKCNGEELRMPEYRRDLKTKCNGKGSKAKMKSFRTCRKRVSRNARTINGACLTGRKPNEANSQCHGNLGEPCEAEENCSSAFTSAEDCFPDFVSKVRLEGKTNIESLPSDILVKIICNLRHDELKPLSCLSIKFRDAVVIARRMHFDFSTPVRFRHPKLMPNVISENSASSVKGLNYLNRSAKRLATPNAPNHIGKFQKPRLFSDDTMKTPKVVFLSGTPAKDLGAIYSSQNYSFRSSCSITGRVLFVEDELCEAIFRNTL